MSGVTPPENAGPAPRRRGWLIPVLALMVGFVVGAGAVGAAWLVSSALSGGATGSDAAMACQALDEVGTVKDPNDISLEQAHRVAGAYELAVAAAERDGRYRPLADQFRRVSQAMTVFDIPAFNRELARAREVCDRLT